MRTNKYHLQEQQIPDGFQIFDERLEVAGVARRRNDAIAFAESKHQWLELEREENNQDDKNAIMVIGCSKGFFGAKHRFIGYVPKEAAKRIVENGFWGKVQPRLLRTYVSEKDYVEILFQILGPKGQRYEFHPPKTEEGGNVSEYVDRIKQLKSENRNNEAVELLLKLVDQTESEAKKEKCGVAPWYYEQLAILYRKDKRIADEVQILERYDSQPKAPGAIPKKLAARLIIARGIQAKQIN